MTSVRPGTDHLKVGDPVLLAQSIYRRGHEYHEAVITVQNRVWWTVEWYDSRMDRVHSIKVHSVKRTTDDNRYDFFTTQERIDWQQREAAAREYLHEQGIELHRSKRWSDDRLTLANLIRRHEGLDEI